MSIGGHLGNEKLGFWYGNNTTWDFSDSTVNDDNWHHVATVFNSTETEFYIDGTLDATVAITGEVILDSSGETAVIGVDLAAGPGRHFDGIIDEVAVFNVGKTQTSNLS